MIFQLFNQKGKITAKKNSKNFTSQNFQSARKKNASRGYLGHLPGDLASNIFFQMEVPVSPRLLSREISPLS
jgi:hypothetical protein